MAKQKRKTAQRQPMMAEDVLTPEDMAEVEAALAGQVETERNLLREYRENLEAARREGAGRRATPEDGMRAPFLALDGLRLDADAQAVEGRFMSPEKFVPRFPFTESGAAVELLDPAYRALLEQLARRGTGLCLTGAVDGERFLVSGVHPDPPESGNIGENVFLLAQRELSGVCRDGAFLREQALLLSEKELLFLIEACPRVYAESLAPWAVRTARAIRSGCICSDAKHHALRALRTVLSIDWSDTVAPPAPEEELRRRLDREFYGMERVKEAILNVAAYVRQTGRLPQYGLLLVGPPGTGKTAIARRVASLLGWYFGRIDCFAATGTALCGSSRVYSNSKMGDIMEQYVASGSKHFVLLCDELDKAARQVVHMDGTGGDAANALLALLDGSGFRDENLECAVPTDGVLVIANVNDASRLSPALRSRFKEVAVPGYSTAEKGRILRRYVLPAALERAGLTGGAFSLTPGAGRRLLKEYAVGPGVRGLEQDADTLIEWELRRRERTGGASPVTEDDLFRALGAPRRRELRAGAPGMVTGICFRDGAAERYQLQAAARPGTGRLELLNFGPRTEAYCRAAYYATREAMPADLEEYDVTVFLPEPIPDEPYDEIGCAFCAALYSAVYGFACPNSEIFLGGCDLLGGLTPLRHSMEAVLKAVEGEGCLLYAPLESVRRPNARGDSFTMGFCTVCQLFAMLKLRTRERPD